MPRDRVSAARRQRMRWAANRARLKWSRQSSPTSWRQQFVALAPASHRRFGLWLFVGDLCGGGVCSVVRHECALFRTWRIGITITRVVPVSPGLNQAGWSVTGFGSRTQISANSAALITPQLASLPPHYGIWNLPRKPRTAQSTESGGASLNASAQWTVCGGGVTSKLSPRALSIEEAHRFICRKCSAVAGGFVECPPGGSS